MKLNNRNVVDVEIENVDPRDYPDFCDAYFCYAIWEDTKEELTDDELIQLTNECGDELNEMAHEYYR
jgi:hypothetical protein